MIFDSPYAVTWQDIINAEPIAELAGLINPEWVYIYVHAADPQLEDCVVHHLNPFVVCAGE